MEKKPNIGQLERWVSSAAGVAGIGVGLISARLGRRGGAATGFALGTELLRRGISGRSMLYERLDVTTLAPKSLAHGESQDDQGKVFWSVRSVTIQRSPQELFHYWRNLENLPSFMEEVESVEMQDERMSHWIALLYGEWRVEWDAETIETDENRRIRWRTIASPPISLEGSVEFIPAPGGRGTEVHCHLEYRLLGGALAEQIARALRRDPDSQLRADLRRFKKLMEAGELVRVDGQPSGRLAA